MFVRRAILQMICFAKEGCNTRLKSMMAYLCSLWSAVHSSRDVGIIFCVMQHASLFEHVESILYMVYCLREFCLYPVLGISPARRRVSGRLVMHGILFSCVL